MENLNYAIAQRLRLIDFLLYHYGTVSRQELIDFFGISGAQATRDFVTYNRIANGNALLNKSTKRWIKSDSFKPVFPV